jgi:hypothetical protein
MLSVPIFLAGQGEYIWAVNGGPQYSALRNPFVYKWGSHTQSSNVVVQEFCKSLSQAPSNVAAFSPPTWP